mmetsp:Transcript_15013/g.28255  ORF Transcript_15013/g.28255 Transcript_15013/m.28255 type:complete len:269 (+) Transcript_15013:182-988(+)
MSFSISPLAYNHIDGCLAILHHLSTKGWLTPHICMIMTTKNKIHLVYKEQFLHGLSHDGSLLFIVVCLKRCIKLCMHHDHQPWMLVSINMFQFLHKPVILRRTLSCITIRTQNNRFHHSIIKTIIGIAIIIFANKFTRCSTTPWTILILVIHSIQLSLINSIRHIKSIFICHKRNKCFSITFNLMIPSSYHHWNFTCNWLNQIEPIIPLWLYGIGITHISCNEQCCHWSLRMKMRIIIILGGHIFTVLSLSLYLSMSRHLSMSLHGGR